MTLRLGTWQSVLADVAEVDAVIVDPPYSTRVHAGHNTGAALANKKGSHRKSDGHRNTYKPRSNLNYQHWDREDVDAFVDAWAPRNRGWFVCFSDHVLCGDWGDAFQRNGFTRFQPLPCVIWGMTVRLAGDGPSSWAVYANVARPKALSRWGTLPGAYAGPPCIREKMVTGGKPLWLMRRLVRDYTKPGDLVVDPCAGGATTLIAAVIEGRRAIGAEVDAATFEVGSRRLACEPKERRFEDLEPTPEQPSLFDAMGGAR